MAEKQEKEDNYNEYDPPAKIRYATRAARKRNRKQNEDHESTSNGSLGNPKKILKQNSSSGSDKREESEEEFGKEPRKRKYTKQAEKKTRRRFPVCDKVSGRNMASTEPILSQAEIDKQLPCIRKKINMKGEIGTASTPLGPRALPRPRNQSAQPQFLRQKPLFGDTPTTTDGEETELNKVSIPDLQPREQGVQSDTPIREKGLEATVSTGQLHKEIIYGKGEFLAVRNTKMIIEIHQAERGSYRTPRNLAILTIWTCWHGGFTCTPKNRYVPNCLFFS